jgi:hypothetical protein
MFLKQNSCPQGSKMTQLSKLPIHMEQFWLSRELSLDFVVRGFDIVA